jgi:hypothetical protein
VDFLGSWTLWRAPLITAQCPHAYALLVEAGVGQLTLVYLPTFPDLLAYMARYGELGQAQFVTEE